MPGPPSARFVRNLEDVLDLYARPADPKRPLVCFDETSKVLHEHYRPPTPVQPGRPARYDYQYDRMGTCNLFLLSAPLLGWREVKVRTRRTAVDCAHVLRELKELESHGAQCVMGYGNGVAKRNVTWAQQQILPTMTILNPCVPRS